MIKTANRRLRLRLRVLTLLLFHVNRRLLAIRISILCWLALFGMNSPWSRFVILNQLFVQLSFASRLIRGSLLCCWRRSLFWRLFFTCLGLLVVKLGLFLLTWLLLVGLLLFRTLVLFDLFLNDAVNVVLFALCARLLDHEGTLVDDHPQVRSLMSAAPRRFFDQFFKFQ